MGQSNLSAWSEALLFSVAGVLFVLLTFLVSRMIRPNRPSDEKLTSYESGEQPVGTAWVQYRSRFYILALIFLLFEVEIVFLFPWATVFADPTLLAATDGWWGWYSLIEMLIFVGVLALGLAYAWVKGHLDWIKAVPEIDDFKSPVPRELYDEVNKKYGKK